MKLIHVAAAMLNQTPLDWQHNTANVRRAIQAARKQSISVLCLPELCLTGYGCEDAFREFQAIILARLAMHVGECW